MEQNCVWLFFYFNFERNYHLLKLKSPCILLSKNINFNKNKMELREMRHGFREMNLKVQLTSESQTESKTVMSWSLQQKNFFVLFILSEGNFLSICVLSQCIVYWIHFQNIHTFPYQKTLLHTLFCLFLRLLKAFSVSLNINVYKISF